MAKDEYRIDTDSPAGPELMFWSVLGYEALSRPSVYELTVLSANADIQAKDILGRGFDVVIGFEDADGTAHERHCQGVAVRFARRRGVGRFHEYRIELRSWFWLLHKRRNSRIMEDADVLQIMEAVLENSPIRAVKKFKKDRLLGKHASRGYCVQFEESDYDYLSRLLEDEGIYYWFDAHAEPGTLHLGDSSAAGHDPLPAAAMLRHAPAGSTEARVNEIRHWESERRLDAGWFDSRDSNWEHIRTKLGAAGGDLEEHELADFEAFEYPGGYRDADAAEVVAGNRVDELLARRERHWALTPWPDVAPGRSFTYEDQAGGARDGKYLIGGCIVAAVHAGYENVPPPPADARAVARLLAQALEGDAVNGGSAPALQRFVQGIAPLQELQRGTRAFVITAWPLDVAFKPPRLTPRRRMPGPQSAIVVGPQGEEKPENGEDLYVDKGRVKVWFHWNRYEKDKKNFDGQKWSAWLRVSQPWAGKGWGGYFTPRIGQEVIVDFLDGDPDRPLIVGRVYNDDQEIPYDSPTRSGFRTRSTPNGKPTNYNEIMFEDRKGEENLNIHAERNMSRSVEADDSTTVGHDQTVKVSNDRTVTTEGNEKREVAKDQRNVVHQHQFTDVTWNQYNNIGLHQQNIIGADGQYNQITGKVETYIGQTMHLGVTGALTQSSASLTLGTGPASVNVGSLLLTSAAEMDVTAGATKINLAGTEITSNGSRSDWVSGEHKFKAETFKYFGTNFNRTVVQANDCILGNNDNAFIGIASDTKLSLSRSAFVGLNMASALALDVSNFIGVKLENCLAVKVSTAAGISADMSSVKTFSPGGGGSGGADGPAALAGWGAVAAKAAAVVSAGAGAVSVAYDGYNAVKQYEDAAEECDREGMTHLATLARRRATMVKGAVIGAAEGAVGGGLGAGPVGAVVGGVVGAVVGGAIGDGVGGLPPRGSGT